MPFHERFDLSTLRGAEYNPRKVDDSDLVALCESLAELGVVKPLIASNTGTLVAGHQRSQALRSLGVTHAPVFILDSDVTTYEEVQFNQLHNGTDMDEPETLALFEGPPREPGRFHEIPPEWLDADFRAPGAPLRSYIARLVSSHGPWGACVMTTDGEIIHAHNYALGCAMTAHPVRAYVIPAEERERYLRRLSREYGRFSYDHIERRSYIQSTAQIPRLSSVAKGGRGMKRSTLYERHALPFLKANPRASLLDFGCGCGDYVKHLRREGYNVLGFDPWHRADRGGITPNKKLAVSKIHMMVDRISRWMRVNGLFDVVLADAVINSVDSIEARDALVMSLASLVKPDGLVMFGGRSRSYQDKLTRSGKFINKGQTVQRMRFLDADGFSAVYRRGSWFFQYFCDRPTVERIVESAGLELKLFEWTGGDDWRAICGVKEPPTPEQIRQAIGYEFNLPIGADKTLNRHAEIIDAILQARS